MKNQSVLELLFESSNLESFGIDLWIAWAGSNHRSTRARFPFDVQMLERAIDASLKNLEQICFEQWQNHLRFGITESGIKFNHPNTVWGQHQTRIKHALIRDSPGVHAAHHRLENFCFYFLKHRCADVWNWCERTHPARVRACVAVTDAFMISSGGHEFEGFAVHKRQHTQFRSSHAFFDQNRAACRAELTTKNPLECLFCILKTITNNYAFAERQTVGFDHKTRTRERVRPHEFKCSLELFKDTSPSGFDTHLRHDFFGKCLTPLELCRVLSWTKRANAAQDKRIHDARRKWIVRTDHHKINLILNRKLE